MEYGWHCAFNSTHVDTFIHSLRKSNTVLLHLNPNLHNACISFTNDFSPWFWYEDASIISLSCVFALCFQVRFNDIIGEPDKELYSFDKIWLYSFKVRTRVDFGVCFSVSKLIKMYFIIIILSWVRIIIFFVAKNHDDNRYQTAIKLVYTARHIDGIFRGESRLIFLTSV